MLNCTIEKLFPASTSLCNSYHLESCSEDEFVYMDRRITLSFLTLIFNYLKFKTNTRGSDTHSSQVLTSAAKYRGGFSK